MSQEESRAQEFLRQNEALAYDDAMGKSIWQLAAKVAVSTQDGFRFSDGSELWINPLSCAIEATGAALPRPVRRERWG